MTITEFSFGLAMLASLTSVITEAVKVFLSEIKIRTAPNFTAGVVSIIVGILYVTCYALYFGIACTPQYCVASFGLIAASWVSSMCGYDKVTQLITQIGGKK